LGSGTAVPEAFVRPTVKVSVSSLRVSCTTGTETAFDPTSSGHGGDRVGRVANHLDDGQRPEEGHVVVADPEGNEFCAIEPGNALVGGCGFLGELACDGTWELGVFRTEGLGWPLVWDQDQETAIQSLHGARRSRGAAPLGREGRPNRQRFDLVPAGGEEQEQTDRLALSVLLGSRSVTTSPSG
jgi:hypothetical protein